MTKEYDIPTYGCPYCDKTVRGPPNNPKLGERNLETHVATSHADKLEEFKKQPIDHYIIEEKEEKKEKEEPEFQKLSKAPQKIEIPINEYHYRMNG